MKALATALIAAAFIVVSIAPPAVAQPPLRTVPLCLAREVPLFSCPIGAKIVSVCGGPAGAIYRYGRPAGRVELTSGDLTSASRGFSGGGETQITAAKGRYRYTVYSRTVRTNFGDSGRHDAQFSSGLVVRQGSRTVMSRSCAVEPTMVSDPGRVVPKGAFIEH